MKLPKNFIKMLENKYVLYFVLFLAITNLLGYLFLGNINAIVFFILVGFLVGNFSKNMIIILTVPLILTSILMVGKKVSEGMETKESTIDTAKENAQSAVTSAKEHISSEHPEKASNLSDLQSSIQEKKEETKTKLQTNTERSLPETGDDTHESTTAPEVEGAEHFQSNGTNKRRNRIDYAATVEDAYGDLNKILGGDGIKRLTEDTQKLMSQQMQLADAMKNMGPLLSQAKDMLKGFDFKELGGIANLAKSFGGLGGPAQV